MVLRLLRKIRFTRNTKRKPQPATIETTPVTLTTVLSVAMTTNCNVGNTTVDHVTMETSTGAMEGASMSDEMELMTLTETMAMVAGMVAFIVVMVMLCFVYRTKFRTSVRMRKTVDRDRRSAAISLDLLELNEYDQRIGRTAALRLPPTVNSPVYGRGMENIPSTVVGKSASLPNSSRGGLNGTDTETNAYYNVIFNKTTDEKDSDINANAVLNRNMDSFKGKPVKTSVGNKMLPSVECIQNDYEENDSIFSNTEHAAKRKLIEDNEDSFTNFHEVDSVELSSSSPPPTPCNEGSYVNVDSVYENELEYSKQGYINVDYRKNSMPEEEERMAKSETKHLTKSKPRKVSKSSVKPITTLMENDSGSSNDNMTASRDKPRKKSNAKENWIIKNKPAWSVSMEDEPFNFSGEIDTNYTPMDATIDRDTHYTRMDSKSERDINYVPMDSSTGRDTHYIRMDSKSEKDTNYVPMDCTTEGSEDVSENVYIFMESNECTDEYMNCATVNSVYENS